MCGICGIYDAQNLKQEDARLLEAMNDALTHRGPDGEGTFVDKMVALGHRRLSIIDLAGGDQPIFNEDRTIAIVFNGEIYNYRELRVKLLAKGHIFKTHSDTEVIVHLYEDLGTACLQELDGMFAFALWDMRQGRLFIARDRFGEKPLYYRFDNGRLLFASELKSLRKETDATFEVDIEALDDFLAYGYIPAPRTIFAGIKKLPPAHYLCCDQGKLEINRYWSPQFTDTYHHISEGEALERLDDLINQSVKLRLRSDVPVGAFLSGGIDSSLIVALAAKHYEGRLATFSIGFQESDFDELGYARQVAQRYGTRHHETIVEDIDTDLFPRIVDHFDEPFADPSALPTYYVTREAAKHLKVCLSGDAGDELFCGYGRYRWEPLEQISDVIPAAIRHPVLEGVSQLLPDSFQGKGAIRRMAVSDHLRWQRKCGPFDYHERQNLFRPEFHGRIDSGAWLYQPYFQVDNIDPISRRMLADQSTYLSEDILVKVDRNSMWNSLEVRVPLLDHKIAEFANALPLSLKTRNGQQKYLIKKILAPLVPDEILTRPKKGFGIPIKYWLQERFYDYSRDLLLSSDSHSRNFFNADSLGKLIDQNKEGKRDLSKRLWALMWFEQWARNQLS